MRLNSPPTIRLDERVWYIFETEPVGSKIARAYGSDNEDEKLVYDLEPLTIPGQNISSRPLPFRIDSESGVVYLNESLKGRVSDLFNTVKG